MHFSATEKTAEENCAIFALRDVNAVVAQEEKDRREARRSLENILEGARTGIWTIELEEGCPPRMYADRTMSILLGVSGELEPEECYAHWFRRIEPDYVDIALRRVGHPYLLQQLHDGLLLLLSGHHGIGDVLASA